MTKSLFICKNNLNFNDQNLVFGSAMSSCHPVLESNTLNKVEDYLFQNILAIVCDSVLMESESIYVIIEALTETKVC